MADRIPKQLLLYRSSMARPYHILEILDVLTEHLRGRVARRRGLVLRFESIEQIFKRAAQNVGATPCVALQVWFNTSSGAAVCSPTGGTLAQQGIPAALTQEFDAF